MAIALVTLAGIGASVPARCRAQQATKTADSTPGDYSDQASVVEDLSTTIRYKDDGTCTTTRTARVKVQSQAGVHAFGIMQFPYASATTTMQMVYVRVIKPDKTVVTTPAENALDMPAQITQEAPFYSDLKVLQVAVKGLEAGDTLEFQWRADRTKPLDPGQFWEAFNFMRSVIVLHEVLQVSFPSDRKVIVESATVQPAITSVGAERVYTWESKNLKLPSDKEAAADDSKPYDVQVTSFQNWDELGKWFGGLVAPRAVATPEIKAKADELTRGDTSETQKIQHLYAFVSTHFRYIGIGLGIGRYQPHAAEDVLSNDYGDCKDKHTLLEALLAAEGIKAYPALINTSIKIDRDVPSPLQFDHVITAIPEGKGFLFLDTTPEVTPFGYLIATLRDKSALVIPDTGTAELVNTPADPPFPLFERFEADGTLDSTGTLKSKMQMTVRDDSEFIIRHAFRQAGQAQWTEVVQKISEGMGFGGTVSDVTVTPPDQTGTPLKIDYSYVRKNYSDFADKWISPPFPPLFVAAVPDDTSKKSKPIKLGTPEGLVYTANVKLPPGVTPKLPADVHLDEAFAKFDATYSMSGDTLHVERKLVTKERNVEPAEFDAFKKFKKAMDDDAKIDIYLGGAGGNISGSSSSSDPEALKLYQEGYQAWQMRDFPGAMDYFQQATQKDPKYAQAWAALGYLHGAMGPREQGVEELKKAIALDPSQPRPYEELGTLLLMQHQTDDALAVWKEMEVAMPDNAMAVEQISEILLELKRYPEAITELEAAVKRIPGSGMLLTELGSAYARSGDASRAASTFKSSLQADSSLNNLNTAAYWMADGNVDLAEALQDAQKAVSGEETATTKIDMDGAAPQDFGSASLLAIYWDTLGWAYFRTGDLDKAEKYLSAGWHLSQDPTIADHLGQLYEREDKKAEARNYYQAAVATRNAPQHAVDRLDAIGGGRGYDLAPLDNQNLRIVQVSVSPKPKDHASADYVVLLSPGKVEARYVSGSGVLQGEEKALEAAKFQFPFPDAGPVKILRRGILDCEPELRQCSFAMYPLQYPQQIVPNTSPNPENTPGATVLKLRSSAPPVVVKRNNGSQQGGSKVPQ